MIFMSGTIELRVGKRGEIYSTSKIRKKTGLTPGGRAVATIEENRLIVEPKLSALTLLEKPRVNVKPLTQEEVSQLRRELSQEIETR